MQVGDMMAFIQYTMQIIMGFLMICMISVMLPRAGVSADRIQEILTSETVIDDPKEAKAFCKEEAGVLKFDHVSFRYPGADDTGIERSEYEPEACFPAWIVKEKAGQTSLYLQEPSTGQCFIPDMGGLPGLPELQPDDIPVRVEMLIRQAHCIFDTVDPTFLKARRNSTKEREKYADLPPSYAEILRKIDAEREKEGHRPHINPIVSTPPVYIELSRIT
jgi:ABC-type multidrug transport system fused ATPase/permease subunit